MTRRAPTTRSPLAVGDRMTLPDGRAATVIHVEHDPWWTRPDTWTLTLRPDRCGMHADRPPHSHPIESYVRTVQGVPA